MCICRRVGNEDTTNYTIISNTAALFALSRSSAPRPMFSLRARCSGDVALSVARRAAKRDAKRSFGTGWVTSGSDFGEAMRPTTRRSLSRENSKPIGRIKAPPPPHNFTLTKIVGTIGPASDPPEVTESLVTEGLKVARINFSHATYHEAMERVENIRAAPGVHRGLVNGSRDLNTRAVLLDTKGPEIRTVGLWQKG